MSSIVNQNQGGGSKKAGFPYQVGRDSWASIAINTCNPKVMALKCCSLAKYNKTVMPMANFSRPIGSTTQSNTYYHIPGTGR
jgi:hypothetical protein